jgi:serine/threonine-protein kinase RsbW
MTDNLLTYVITPGQGTIAEMAVLIQKLGMELGWSEKCVYQLNLSLDEIISNTLAYGYARKVAEGVSDVGSAEGSGIPRRETSRVVVALERENTTLRLTIRDNAAPFDPLLQAPMPEVDKPLMQRKRRVGGVGIHLARSMMDFVDYRFEQGMNVLVMEKSLESPIPCGRDS